MSPILLVLGAGPNVGHHVGLAFAAKGYRIVLASRKGTGQESTPERTYAQVDLSSSQSIINLFAKVKETLGAPPSAVIYNASVDSRAKADDPLSGSLANFEKDLAINTIGVFAAAQQAVLGFAELPDSASKTFIFTGNITNEQPIAALMNSGIGKSATAHLMQSAAAAYAKKGYKFYYADERNADGTAVYMAIDGPAHGEHYLHLSEGKEQGPWQQTFVKGVGYKKF